MWNLIELFTNLDLAQLSLIMEMELIPSLNISPLAGNQKLPDISSGALTLLPP